MYIIKSFISVLWDVGCLTGDMDLYIINCSLTIEETVIFLKHKFTIKSTNILKTIAQLFATKGMGRWAWGGGVGLGVYMQHVLFSSDKFTSTESNPAHIW